MFVSKRKDKRGISVLVSYVLLVTLAVALAATTYFFILPYARKPLPEEACPEGISIVIENYSCVNNKINITIKNRGLHDVTGVYIKTESTAEELKDLWEISARVGCDPFYQCTPCGIEASISPGDECFVEIPPQILTNTAKIVLIPYRVEKEYTTLCKDSVVKLGIEC